MVCDSIQGWGERPQAVCGDTGDGRAADAGPRGHLRLLFMGGRAIQAVMRQNREPNWIAYVGVPILLGPKEAMDGGARAAGEDPSNTR